ncbi:phosphatase PAP2 family protein [Bacteroides sp. ET71]|uniref:phosphatase PAP2 family protein n=1 Tax=Bacteroides sp. ET71 TaxID=2939421 RepID=UPI00293EA147|nr:phosphatase PAP2 family protein [Bacteroides sp. ET71]
MLMTDFLQLLNDLDSQLLLAINGLHNPYFDTFMYAYSGKWIWIPMYAALVYVLFRNLSWRVALACLVGVALTITFADQIGASVIRPWVERLRPANLENPLSEYVHIVNGYRGGSYGFPSCHAANTFGLTFYLMFLIRRRGFTLFMCAWALLTCYSRSYLGVHYPGDLLAGALLGLCGAALMYGLFRWLVGYRRPQHFKDLWVPMVTGGLTVAGMLVYAAF